MAKCIRLFNTTHYRKCILNYQCKSPHYTIMKMICLHMFIISLHFVLLKFLNQTEYSTVDKLICSFFKLIVVFCLLDMVFLKHLIFVNLLHYLVSFCRILLYCDDVELGFDGNNQPEFKGHKKGRLYLTTHRVSLICTQIIHQSSEEEK